MISPWIELDLHGIWKTLLSLVSTPRIFQEVWYFDLCPSPNLISTNFQSPQIPWSQLSSSPTDIHNPSILIMSATCIWTLRSSYHGCFALKFFSGILALDDILIHNMEYSCSQHQFFLKKKLQNYAYNCKDSNLRSNFSPTPRTSCTLRVIIWCTS